MNEEKIKNYLKNDNVYQSIKTITINVSILIQVLIYKKIITEEEFENTMKIVSKIYEETENEKIKDILGE